MKKQIFINALIFILLTVKCFSACAQQNVTDTSAYLKQITATKNNYVGKPFSALEKDLKLPIIEFSPVATVFSHKNWETCTVFYFRQHVVGEGYSVGYHLIVYWKPYLDASVSNQIGFKSKTKWNAEADSFYNKAIITDIRYDF